MPQVLPLPLFSTVHSSRCPATCLQGLSPEQAALLSVNHTTTLSSRSNLWHGSLCDQTPAQTLSIREAACTCYFCHPFKMAPILLCSVFACAVTAQPLCPSHLAIATDVAS
jgi:hypothetical protein